jgi:hypothetical protein
MEVFHFTRLPLYPRGKNTQYPLDRRLAGPQSRSGRRGEEKNALPGIEPQFFGRPVHSLSLYRLGYSGSPVKAVFTVCTTSFNV